MMERLWRLAICCLCILLFVQDLQAALPDIPSIKGHFTDEGKKVSTAANERIDKSLGAIQERCKVDAAVVILPHPVKSLEEMARSCFLGWGIGKNWDAGVLVVVASDGSDCVIFQGAANAPLSEQAREIVESSIRSEAKLGHYERAISCAVGRLQRLVQAKYKPVKVFPPLENDPRKGAAYGWGAAAVFLLALASWRLRSWR